MIFNYLVPALYFNATVTTPIQMGNMGNLSTGGSLAHAHAISGTLRSEPGFEPSFTATFLYGDDYLTIDPTDGISRKNLRGVVVPDDGDIPFQMHGTGIQLPSAEFITITTTNATGLAAPYGSFYSVWVPTFLGGSEKYANLQNSIFVGSQAVSSGPNPGEFLLGIKISKVFSTNTSVVIGQEFP